MRPRAELIDALSRGSTRAGVLRRSGPITALWLVGAWTFTVAAAHRVQGMRPGFATQLANSPHFAAETLLGLVAGVAVLTLAVRLGVPGTVRPRRATAVGLGGLLVWAGAYVYGLIDPALPASTLGARPACFLEVILYGVPIVLAALLLLRRLAPLERVRTGMLAGAAAGAIPALLMEIACMYVPGHILTHHIAPIAAVVAAGAVLGPRVLRRI